MTSLVSHERIAACYQIARSALLAQKKRGNGSSLTHWEGKLSASALSTATAVMALELVRRNGSGSDRADRRSAVFSDAHEDLNSLIDRGLEWLASHQNDDGGWGDTTKSLSNISTTMLAHAVFHATGTAANNSQQVEAARKYIDRVGGVQAVFARYGRDRTFSVPILTHCSLGGSADWSDVIPLPFELACLPARFYKTVRLPVVSYALPALIAVGQVRYFHRKPLNPVTRLIRRLAVAPSLRVLENIQPANGGFLEATPLTSFVTMSLASMGLSDHPITKRGVEFIRNSVLEDGSWPIDTNLATWVTTLSVNALRQDVPQEDASEIREWLLKQQYKDIHPYTNTDPGGWAWTDLPGGVPDADDTPGAILALLNLRTNVTSTMIPSDEQQALASAVQWLLDLQNRDRGWPTFCRGWGTQPFDRSAPDISAHVLRAFTVWLQHPASKYVTLATRRRTENAIRRGFQYLAQSQRTDGSWLPIWFGNQFSPGDENPTYGTARVLSAYRDGARLETTTARRGLQWMLRCQNEDGGWGGNRGIPSSVEETSLAVEILLSQQNEDTSVRRGLAWLMDRVEQGTFHEATPIGFYFAKLWYFESIYPLSFTVSALNRALCTTTCDVNGSPVRTHKYFLKQNAVYD